ncbi:hypothetical protein [Nonomuraea roseoviolacea]|uniref:hypothetical protein n=1 Tax=Nonomuraea roseoviolacea TaxID=103837 RepID=UPI0031D97BE8
MADIIETRTVHHEGVDYFVQLTHDHDTNPETDGDWASPEDLEWWRRDDWQYVIVTVTPVIAGAEITTAADVLGSVVYGFLPKATIDMDAICNVHPVPDMIDVARDNLRKVRPVLVEALTLF